MYARAVDEAAIRLHELRREEWDDLGVGAIGLALAVVAAQVQPTLAIPLLLGSISMAVLGVRARWRRWDLVDRLAGDRDAYAISEVAAYASREAAIERRRGYAALIRRSLGERDTALRARLAPLEQELESLASDLDDEELALEPGSAVDCRHLLTEVADSPLFNPALPQEDLRSRIRRIRAGFGPVPPTRSGWTP
jgi:hypothetical protein